MLRWKYYRKKKRHEPVEKKSSKSPIQPQQPQDIRKYLQRMFNHSSLLHKRATYIPIAVDELTDVNDNFWYVSDFTMKKEMFL